MAAGNQRKLEFILRSKRLLLAHKINYVCMNTSPNVNEDRHFFSKRHRLKRGLDSGLWTLIWTLHGLYFECTIPRTFTRGGGVRAKQPLKK